MPSSESSTPESPPAGPHPTHSRRSVLMASSGMAFAALGVPLSVASVAVADGPSAHRRGARVLTPSVKGPIPFDAPGSPGRNYPFLATDVDLAGRGYVLEEFFFSGSANSYDLPVPTVKNDPPLPTADRVVSTHPYTTRMVIHRPADPAKFNGTVFVEWTNTTANYEVPIWWQRNHEFLIREGYGYVGVAANQWGVHADPHGLKHWSPERYASLDIPLVLISGATEVDPIRHDDQLSYDIFAQAMKAVKAVPRVMGTMPVRHVIAGGHSRSAVHLGVYLNAVHPRAPIADGVMPLIAGRQVRPALDIPVMKVLSETDFVGMYDEWTQNTARQPDTDRFRTWWMSGTTHGDLQSSLAGAATTARDLGDQQPAPADCDLPGLSRVQSHHVVSAAMAAMVRWITDGVPPAHSPLPEFTTTPPGLVRDEHANGLGGIRLATFDVPVATDRGTTSCANHLVGTHVPFDDATLRKLYPAHDDYVAAVVKGLLRNVRDGFLLKEDATVLAEQVRASIVGTGLATGPLITSIGDFTTNPSISILRDHTQLYYFRNGAPLLATLDRAVTAAAEGYTAHRHGDRAVRREAFTKAVGLVRKYREETSRMPHEGRADPATSALLVRYADTLIDKLAAERDK
ncbi:alpha/beta hydrolase domain-containing protein [Streptomyces sp. NPDC002790]|uniref:alpha/beta hydrolase domain-containing protein n=1 Tax=Streptomyces sp. NPDC002790 TaxID=3154431 RepID=UPI0033179E66